MRQSQFHSYWEICITMYLHFGHIYSEMGKETSSYVEILSFIVINLFTQKRNETIQKTIYKTIYKNK